MKPINLSEVDFIVESEREEKNPTIFKLRPASGMERVELGYMVLEKGKAEAIRSTIEGHLIGWENFGGSKFDDDMDVNISLLDKETIMELFNEITRISNLSEDEVKN